MNKSRTKFIKQPVSSLADAEISTKMAVSLAKIVSEGKNCLDLIASEMGARLVEAILLAERECVAGAKYHPTGKMKKWASQPGSVYIGKGKTKIRVPRLRDGNGEVKSKIYEKLKAPEAFSEELLSACICGLSARRYEELVETTGEVFGVSRSSISRKVKLSATKKLKDLAERRLDDFEPFAIFMDAMHRCQRVVMAAIGVDVDGNKRVLGLWEGGSENAEMCKSFLSDMESRGLSLHPDVLFITDGGTGLTKALVERFGRRLKQQRCIIHKKRNVEAHLPKKYRAEFKRRYDTAMNMVSYDDAKKELLDVLEWLEGISVGAAKSLREGGERLLTLHRLGVPPTLRKSLITTNIIESSFNGMDTCEKNVKRYRDVKMFMRWMAADLCEREKHFHRLEGYATIPEVIKKMREKSFSLLDRENLVA